VRKGERVEPRELVERAQAGHVAAFTALVERFQEMGFGYALAILGDVHLAQDATQEAFVAAFRNLGQLRHPDKFPRWLRGIVRRQCWHLLRQRRAVTVPLDEAAQLAAPAPDVAQQVAERAELEEVLAAIAALPPAEREVTVLFALRAHSQREVAAFLDLPVTTVNNRLHAARRRLRGGLLTMANDMLKQHGLPADFAARVGRLIRSRGPLIEARFPPDHVPPILTALTIGDPAQHVALTADVAQRLAPDLIRGVVATPAGAPGALRANAEVVNTGQPAAHGLDEAALREVVAHLSRAAEPPNVLETGIKVIDLFCPLAIESVVGLLGDMGTGKMVLIEELIHNLADAPARLAAVTFVGVGPEVALVRGVAYSTSAAVQAIYLPVEDARTLPPSMAVAGLDATLVFSRELAAARHYPAIDPLRSASRFLDPAVVGEEHVAVARGVRELLERARAVEFQGGARSDAERQTLARAARAQRLLTQPLFVAADYTGTPGQFVPMADTVSAFAALLRGDYDHLPEAAFLWRGARPEGGEAAGRPGSEEL